MLIIHNNISKLLLPIILVVLFHWQTGLRTVAAEGSISNLEHAGKLYKSGKTMLELRVFPDKSGLAVKEFNHPYLFDKDTLVGILSSVYYRDKDIMMSMAKEWKKGKHIFQEDEIERLSLLIIEAFARAAPEQDVLVSSYSDRFLLEDLNNIFTLFVEDNKLNIVFSKVRHRGAVNVSPAFNARKSEILPEPTRMTQSHFWEIVPVVGQQLKSGHKNWLIIDFRSELFVHEAQKRRQEAATRYKKKFEPIVDPLEDRIRKLEKALAKDRAKAEETSISDETLPASVGDLSPADEEAEFIRQTDEDYTVGEDDTVGLINISERFHALKELLEEGLITGDDYEQKKSELLDRLLERDLKVGLKELKGLRDGGFISEEDFEYWKQGLLDKL